MKRKKWWIVFGGLSFFLCFSGGILAMTETSVTNRLRTGVVDIELSEYEIADGKEQPYTDKKNILPGQSISKIPRIHNRGEDCYVRAKLELRDTDEEISVNGMGEQWIAGKDGYYYYTDVFLRGMDMDLFQSIRIPETFSQEKEGEVFSLNIDVDAIQNANFTPDFESDAPWGPVQIQRCIRDGEYDFQMMKAADNQSLRVIYQGDSKKLFHEGDDFFVNFPVLMPGDIYEDTAVLQNDSETPVPLYFRSAAEHGQELVEKLGLTVTTEMEGKMSTVYEGTLEANELEESLLLATLPEGAGGKFHFKITVPPELDNTYTVLTNQVQWIFSTEPIQPEEPEILTEIPEEVRTGDVRKTGIFLLAAGVLLGIGSFILRRKSDGKKEIL